MEKLISGGFQLTTNNRMEIIAVIEGLRALKQPSTVEVYSDSRYVVDAVSKGWIRSWKSRGWAKKTEGELANVDLWKTLDLLLEVHEVKLLWVRGHSGDPNNERVDREAVRARKLKDNPVDAESPHAPF